MTPKEKSDLAMVEKLHTRLATERFLELARRCGELHNYIPGTK